MSFIDKPDLMFGFWFGAGLALLAIVLTVLQYVLAEARKRV